MVAPGNNLYQELFVGQTPLGGELKLVKMSDGRCAIFCEGRVVKIGETGEDAMHRLIDEFLTMLGDSGAG